MKQLSRMYTESAEYRPNPKPRCWCSNHASGEIVFKDGASLGFYCYTHAQQKMAEIRMNEIEAKKASTWKMP